ncbi:MAG: hypothetical protein RB296_02695 [Acidobacteriota bacterium]|nr:hypothetical protein [Acidobacteriota bacterium]
MIFHSHLFSMVVYALIVSVMLGFLKYESPRRVFRYSLKLFTYMVGGVIVFSWIMYFV